MRSCGNLIPLENILDVYPELKEVLLELKKLEVLLAAPDFPERSSLASLERLAFLAQIKGLETLETLKNLNQLDKKNVCNNKLGGAIKVGELFGQYTKVPEEYQRSDLEAICQYEEHYMRLLRNYAGEIKEIQAMMESLRKEREEFYRIVVPETERQIQADKVLSDEAKNQWIEEFHDNMERSFRISEELISHYVTSNLKEFKQKLQDSIDKV